MILPLMNGLGINITPTPRFEYKRFNQTVTEKILMISQVFNSQGIDAGVPGELGLHCISIYELLTPRTGTDFEWC